jgi:predicted kinase
VSFDLSKNRIACSNVLFGFASNEARYMSTRTKCDEAAPLLLLLKGHPGSGKSTLAKQVARHLHLSLADKDDARDCFRAAEEQYGPAAAWDLNALSYEVMFSVAASQLACQQSVVVDSPLSKVELYQKALAVAEKVRRLISALQC